MLIVDSHVNRNIVPDCVVGDVVLDVVLGALGDDLRDGVSVGTGLVVIDIEGDVALGVIGHRLEHLAIGVLERERELPLLECAPFKHFLSPNCYSSL